MKSRVLHILVWVWVVVLVAACQPVASVESVTEASAEAAAEAHGEDAGRITGQLTLGGGLLLAHPQIAQALLAGISWVEVSDAVFEGEDAPISITAWNEGELTGDARGETHDPAYMEAVLDELGLGGNVRFAIVSAAEQPDAMKLIYVLEPLLPGPIVDQIEVPQADIAVVMDELASKEVVAIVPQLQWIAQAGDYTFEGGVPESAGAPIGLNQSTLIVYVRASDDATANLNNLRTTEEAEFGNVTAWFRESSFNQVGFNYTHAPAAGWYQLSDTYDDYMWTAADIAAAVAAGDATAEQTPRDGQNLVQRSMNFISDSLQAAQNDGNDVSTFSQIVVVIIGPFHRGTSFSTMNVTLVDGAGNNFQVSVPWVVVSTNTNWSRTAHEFGHAFGQFADLYGAPARRMGNWDVMDCTDCGAQTSGWHKDKRAGWLTGAMKTIVRPAPNIRLDDTTILIPYETENPAAGAVQSLRLNVGGGMYLYVENRQTLAGQVSSQGLPANGVIISDAVDNAGGVNATRKHILFFGGPLGAGDTFTDQTFGPLKIEVSAVPGAAQSLEVKTGWGPDPFYDLTIRPWSPPPWESPDIWIDSQVNVWDTYEYTDGGGNPIRNGDRPRVGRNNRLYARVTNTGNVAATNVRVSFVSSTPPGIGDTGNWALIDRATIPRIEPGATAVTPAVIWRPNASAHTCIEARIDVQADELNANNNVAQENVGDFDTTSASPWKPIESEVDISNPTQLYQTVRLEITGLPDGWTGWVSDRFVSLAPDETKRVRYTIDPGEAYGFEVGSRIDVNTEGWILSDDAEVALGGVTAAVHLVEKSRVVIDAGFGSEVPYEQITLNPEEVRVYVGIQPQRADVPVAVEVQSLDDGTYAMANGVTNSSGSAELTLADLEGELKILEGGRYRLRGLSYGTASLASAASETFDFTVVP